MCKFVKKAFKKVEKLQNKLLKPLGINTNLFGGKLKKRSVAPDTIQDDVEALAEEASRELEEEKSEATEDTIQNDTIQQTSAKRFRSGARGRRSLLRSKSGGGAGFYNRFQL